MADLDAAAIIEIAELHAEFERWFRGDSESLERVEQALSHSFFMVPPSGEIVERAELLTGLRGARGAVHLSIEIRDPVVRWSGVGGLLVSYEEWQSTPHKSNGRRSIALFESDPAGPNGLKWVHVQESWISDS